jgi:hypothetical protein
MHHFWELLRNLPVPLRDTTMHPIESNQEDWKNIIVFIVADSPALAPNDLGVW